MLSQIMEVPTKIRKCYRLGFDESAVIQGLKELQEFFSQIQQMQEKAFDHNRLLMLLYYLGQYSAIANDRELIIDCESLIQWHKKKIPYPTLKEVYALEKIGFTIKSIQLDEAVPKAKRKIKDLKLLEIVHEDADFLMALKVFASACKINGVSYFKMPDLRLLSEDAPKPYFPPVEELMEVLEPDTRMFALQLHDKMIGFGCKPKLDTSKIVYKYKNRNIGTIFFYDEYCGRKSSSGWMFKLSLKHLDNYIDYLSDCPEYIRSDILISDNHAQCGRGHRCSGVEFEYEGKKYVKCPTQAFRFYTISQESMQFYMRLLELEFEAMQIS